MARPDALLRAMCRARLVRRKAAACVAVALGGLVMTGSPAHAAGEVMEVEAAYSSPAGVSSVVVDLADAPEGTAVVVRDSGAPLASQTLPFLGVPRRVGLVVEARAQSRTAAVPDEAAIRRAAAVALVKGLPTGSQVVVAATGPPTGAPLAVTDVPQALEAVGRLGSAEVATAATGASEAVRAAVRRMPANPAGPGLLVVQSPAAEATPVAAPALARQLSAAQVLTLVVATGGQDYAYWRDVVALSGGAVIRTDPPQQSAALSGVLRSLRVVSFTPVRSKASALLALPVAGSAPLTRTVALRSAWPTGAVEVTGDRQDAGTLVTLAVALSTLVVLAAAVWSTMSRRARSAFRHLAASGRSGRGGPGRHAKPASAPRRPGTVGEEVPTTTVSGLARARDAGSRGAARAAGLRFRRGGSGRVARRQTPR